MRRDEREQRISDVEYLSQAVRAKAEECLAAVDDGELSLAKCVQQHKPSTAALSLNAACVAQPVLKLSADTWIQPGIKHVALVPAVLLHA